MAPRHMASRRIVGLDIAKSIAIFLVILIHYTFYSGLYANTVMGNALSVLSCIGVPMFFMVNGYLLLHKRNSEQKIYSKAVHVVAILLIWKILSLPIVSALVDKPINWHKVPAYLLGGAYDDVPLGYFWFINALIAIYILFPVLKRVYDLDFEANANRLRTVVIAIGTLVFGGNLANTVWEIVMNATQHSMASPFQQLSEYNLFGQYAYALVYFLMGGYVGCIIHWLTERFGRCGVIALPIALFLGCYMLLFALQRYQAHVKGVAFYVENGYQNILVLGMTLSVFILLMQIVHLPAPLTRLVTVGGSTTLGVYYLHIMLIVLAQKVVVHFGIATPLWVNMLVLCCIYLVGLVISQIGRHIPVAGALFAG